MIEQTKTQMSAAEFEALPESLQPTELIERELVVRGSPTINHQRVVFNIATKLRELMPDGEVFIAPTSVKLDDANYYQPDVIWVSASNDRCEIVADGINGSPDLVVEVISPGTGKVDRGIKFETYQQFGIREYWIAEPDESYLEVWHLIEGRYRKVGLFEADESFDSTSVEKVFSLGGIFPTA